MTKSIYVLYYGGLELGETTSDLYNKDHDFKLSVKGNDATIILFDGTEKHFKRNEGVEKVRVIRIDYDNNNFPFDKEVVKSLDLDDVAFLEGLK